jgi:hypothetical protein
MDLFFIKEKRLFGSIAVRIRVNSVAICLRKVGAPFAMSFGSGLTACKIQYVN